MPPVCGPTAGELGLAPEASGGRGARSLPPWLPGGGGGRGATRRAGGGGGAGGRGADAAAWAGDGGGGGVGACFCEPSSSRPSGTSGHRSSADSAPTTGLVGSGPCGGVEPALVRWSCSTRASCSAFDGGGGGAIRKGSAATASLPVTRAGLDVPSCSRSRVAASRCPSSPVCAAAASCSFESRAASACAASARAASRRRWSASRRLRLRSSSFLRASSMRCCSSRSASAAAAAASATLWAARLASSLPRRSSFTAGPLREPSERDTSGLPSGRVGAAAERRTLLKLRGRGDSEVSLIGCRLSVFVLSCGSGTDTHLTTGWSASTAGLSPPRIVAVGEVLQLLRGRDPDAFLVLRAHHS